MKLYVILMAAGLVALGACSKAGTPALESTADSASYAVGMSMGSSLAEVQEHVDLALVVQGLEDAAAGHGALSEGDARRLVRAFAQQMEETMARRQSEQADANASNGAAYRAENAKRSGVQTTASGLQYEVLKNADGPKPTSTNRVTVHYRGTLIDGTEFDSSLGDEPRTFALNRVIPGWTEAVQLMPVGSKYRFVLPPELGYGTMGSPPDIGPNATLIFEVELLGIEQ